MVYTDGVHMIADSLEELHNFARLIHLNKCWFSYSRNGKIPHYDLMKSKLGRSKMLKEAIVNGARHCSDKELVKIARGEFFTKTIVEFRYSMMKDEAEIWGMMML
jgi:hypothetical protein